jgi:hypothetical protein
VILSYPAALSAAALLFAILFAAFAIGRTMNSVAPPDQPPPPPPKPPAPIETKPGWTIVLLKYPATSAKVRKESLEVHIEPTRKKLLEEFKAKKARTLEWTERDKKYIGLVYGRWDRPDHPQIADVAANLRKLEPFGGRRKLFKDCYVMRLPDPD